MSTCLNNQKYKFYNVYDFVSNLGPFTSSTFSPDGTYVLLTENHCIRKICMKSGQVSTFSGNPNVDGFKNGLKEQAMFYLPTSLTFSPDGKYIFICDCYNHCIRLICVKSGQVTTFEGLSNEQNLFNEPYSLTFSPCGTYMLVCDVRNHCIRRICVKSGQISTFAGIPEEKGSRNGPKEQAEFNNPISLTFSPDKTYILVCDNWNDCIRKICLKTGIVHDFSLRKKEKIIIRLTISVIFSPDGTFLLASSGQHDCCYKICMESGNVSIFAGIQNESGSRNGPKEQATFRELNSFTFSPDGTFILVCESNVRLIKI
jgi:WD40 repeat protein